MIKQDNLAESRLAVAMMVLGALAILTLALVGLPALADAADDTCFGRQVEIRYHIVSNGGDEGSMNMVRTMDGQNRLQCRVLYEFLVEGLFSDERVVLSYEMAFADRSMQSFDNTIAVDDERVRIWGELAGEELLVRVIEPGGESESFQMSAASFDGVDQGLALVLADEESFPDGSKLRILNTSEFEVLEATLVSRVQESLRVAGRTFECRRVELNTGQSITTCWVAEDEFGPFLVKEIGRDDNGPYSTTLARYVVAGG